MPLSASKSRQCSICDHTRCTPLRRLTKSRNGSSDALTCLAQATFSQRSSGLVGEYALTAKTTEGPPTNLKRNKNFRNFGNQLNCKLDAKKKDDLARHQRTSFLLVSFFINVPHGPWEPDNTLVNPSAHKGSAKRGNANEAHGTELFSTAELYAEHRNPFALKTVAPSEPTVASPPSTETGDPRPVSSTRTELLYPRDHLRPTRARE